MFRFLDRKKRDSGHGWEKLIAWKWRQTILIMHVALEKNALTAGFALNLLARDSDSSVDEFLHLVTRKAHPKYGLPT